MTVIIGRGFAELQILKKMKTALYEFWFRSQGLHMVTPWEIFQKCFTAENIIILSLIFILYGNNNILAIKDTY